MLSHNLIFPKNVTPSSTLYLKTQSKRELQQIAFNYSSDFDLPYTFVATDATLTSDNPLHFRNIFLVILAVDGKIRDEKLSFGIVGEAVKISALSCGKLINLNILQVKKY